MFLPISLPEAIHREVIQWRERAPQSIKRALYSTKRAIFSIKRALYVITRALYSMHT